jgi:hypothetical protein
MMQKNYYDGKNEFLDIIGGKHDESPLSKELKYKLCPDISIDVDVSKWAIDSYVRKYDFLKEGIVSTQENCTRKYEIELGNKGRMEVYRGDTMTSFANIFKHYINTINPVYGRYFRGINSLAKQILEEKDLEKFETEIDPEIIEFAGLVHTEGNLIPVPLCFNVERSGSFADCDFWDIVMKAVYDWYEISRQNDDYSLIKLLGHKNNHIEKSVQLCKEWLSHFNNWNDFINQNHLQPFVYKGNPIEFWDGHFEGGSLITTFNSKKKKQFIEFIKLLNNAIRERNSILQEE